MCVVMAADRTVSLTVALFLLAFSLVPTLSLAQATVSTGSIVGNVSDPSGAVINSANLTITNLATGQAIEITTNSSGSFNSGALAPGNYSVLISAQGFTSTETTMTVLVGNTAALNVSLQIGREKNVIEVQDSALRFS